MDCTKLIQRYNKLKARRDGNWLAVWREVRKYVYPTYSDYRSEGGLRGAELFDDTAILARGRLAAGIYNWMAPPDKRWYEIEAADEELQKDGGVRDYFAECSKLTARALANSNWPTVLIQLLNEAAAGIDAICYCEEAGTDTGHPVFYAWPAETVVYAENAKGEADTLFREYKMTARQIVEEFGEAKTPERIRNDARDMARQDQEYRILHAIYPRTERDPDMLDGRNMPYADVYIELDTKTVISEGGHHEKPFAVCRFEKAENESCGRGPGLNKLPSIKMLQRMRQVYITNSEFNADPSWLIPDGSLVDNKFDKSPGATNIYRPSMDGARPEPVFKGGDLVRLAADIEAERENVKAGFFWDIFDPLGELKNITATEAEIRNEGKIIPFAPIAGNLHTELFKPVIHRVFGILSRAGKLPDVPRKLLENPEYKIEFVSKIALSIRKLESLGWLQTEASLANIAAVKPDIMDNFELDDVARDIALSNGAAPKWLVPEKERDAVRQQRAAEQQAMQQAAILAEGAKLAPDLSKAPEPGSPLSDIMEGNGI